MFPLILLYLLMLYLFASSISHDEFLISPPYSFHIASYYNYSYIYIYIYICLCMYVCVCVCVCIVTPCYHLYTGSTRTGEGKRAKTLSLQETGQRADSVHPVEKLCSFYHLNIHRHPRERAGMGECGGSAVGAR